MNTNNAVQFQEKVDEILKDTEEFVNATKQLNAVRIEMSAYMDNAVNVAEQLKELVNKASQSVTLAMRFFDGDFTQEFSALLNELNDAAENSCDKCDEINQQLGRIVTDDARKIKEYCDSTSKIIEGFKDNNIQILSSLDAEAERILCNVRDFSEQTKKHFDEILSDERIQLIHSCSNRINEAADRIESKYDALDNIIKKTESIESGMESQNKKIDTILELLEKKDKKILGFINRQ